MTRKKDYEYTKEELAEIAINNPDFSSPAFQWYVNDFWGSNKIKTMTPEEVGGYIFLLNFCWNEKDCGMPSDDSTLEKISYLFRRWESCKNKILNNFFIYKERYYNLRLLKERKKQIAMRKQRIEAVRKRYEKPTKDLRNTLRNVDEDVDVKEDSKRKRKHKYGEYKNVLLTDEELQKLNNDYGKEKTNSAIEYLSLYKAEKPYKTKSDYLTIKRWVFKAVSEKKSEPKSRMQKTYDDAMKKYGDQI